MSDNQLPHQNNRHVDMTRPQPTRPPIEWPTRSSTTSPDNERATNFARKKLERTYAIEGEPNQVATSITSDVSSDSQPNHHQDQHTQHTMRDQPFNPHNYHAAWQQYYHQYFYRYYAGWWQQQKQQLESDAQAKIQSATQQNELINQPYSEKEQIASELRKKIRTTVNERAKKVKSSSHFKPLLAAFSVGTAFLLINYNQVLVGAVKQYVAPGNVALTPVILEPNSSAKVPPEPKIIIPKIGVEAPVVYDEERVDEASYQNALERGVVRLGTTADPGTKGNVVIGGHSSNNVFNAGQFKYVFVNLKRLDVGDILYLNYNAKRYTYKVTVAKKVITPQDVSVLQPTNKPTVTLFTCDPPGTNINRLIVQAEQIDPNPTAATTNTKEVTKVNEQNPLPSVAPSIWDRLFR